MASPPFSIVEFGNLVALALDADRFSQSFLQFDPELSAPAPVALKAPLRSLSKSTMAPRTPPSSPTRGLLDKIKLKASALVKQTTKPTLSSASSFFDDEPKSLFAPYARAATRKPKSTRAIFSRPASLVTAPPPSPTKSTRSFSSTSSASPPTPTTDTDFFAPRPSTSVSASASACSTSRWSLSTDESTTSSMVESFSYPNHPFASTHDVTQQASNELADPFAKGRVQVIRNRNSADYPRPAYTYAFSSSNANCRRRSNPRPSTDTLLVPVPVPKPKVLRIHVQPPTARPPDWTLALPARGALTFPRPPSGTPPGPRRRGEPPASPTESSESSDSHSTCPSAWNQSPPTSPRRRHGKGGKTPTQTHTPTQTPTQTLTPRERERARALAVLNGEVHPSALEAFALGGPPREEEEYYSAKESLCTGKESLRGRVDSLVRGEGGC